MRNKLSGISLFRTCVCSHKVLGHTQTWAEGLVMMKVATAINGLLPRQALATLGHVISTSFVLCRALHGPALHGPDGLCDHELVVHDCGVGQDDNAHRVCERMRDLWLSDWLLLDSQPVPPREDVLFIIADACDVGRLTEWQNTGMTQKPLDILEQIL